MCKSKVELKFTADELKLIRAKMQKGATKDHYDEFIYHAQRTGLHPLRRECNYIIRSGVGTFQTAIDGFRVIAERSGTYAGQDAPVFDELDGDLSATVTVYKMVDGVRCGFSHTAFLSEYKGSGPFWASKKKLMTAKCAESNALRKAFPNDLAGLYSDEEMEQAGNGEAPKTEDSPKEEKPKNGDALAELVKLEAEIYPVLKAKDNARMKYLKTKNFKEATPDDMNEYWKHINERIAENGKRK